MANIPYLTVLSATLAASGTGTLTKQVPDGQVWHINRLYFTSTGAFNVTSIRDAKGQYYANVSPSNPLPSTMLGNVANANNTFVDLPLELVIEGGNSVYVDVTDTSAAGNTVKLLLVGTLETGA